MNRFVLRLLVPMIIAAALPFPATAQTMTQNTTLETAPVSWTEKVTIGGDFRLRAESLNMQGSPNRFRNRFQIRPNLSAKVNDQLTMQFRLASAGSATEGITTSNQTMDDANSKKPVWIDLAYIDWAAMNSLRLQGGKIPNPYWSAGKNQMIWDSDLTFEGAAVRWSTETEAFKWAANLGGHWLNERSNVPTGGSAEPGADALMGGAQALASVKGDMINGTLGLTYYSLTGLKNAGFLGQGQKGNSASPSGGYRYDFRLLNAGVEVGTNAVGLPMSAYFEWVQNDDASDDNRGTIAGLRIGKLKDAGSWAVDYSYRTVEADAVVGTFTESDFVSGNTDVRGHKANLQFQAATGVIPALTYYAGEGAVRTAATNNERWQLDVMFIF